MKMKKNLFISILSLFIFAIGCQKEDRITAPPARPYTEVYPEDLEKIEGFLDTHYVVIDSDFNTTFFEIEEGGTETPISQMPELTFKNLFVEAHDVDYKIYYLNLNQGIGETVTRVDSAMVAYKGFSFQKATNTEIVGGETVTTEYTAQIFFDERISPIWFQLEDVIRGWGAIIPQFNTGTITNNPDGSNTYGDFGAGVMFLPSALGYYNSATGNIPSYAPLVFNFKLYNQKSRDHDFDRILSKYEYGSNFEIEANDTDDDGLPDYLDPDDDGDGFLTKFEIRYEPDPVGNPGVYDYYDYSSIPDCSGDQLSSSRVRKHLDSSCQ